MSSFGNSRELQSGASKLQPNHRQGPKTKAKKFREKNGKLGGAVINEKSISVNWKLGSRPLLPREEKSLSFPEGVIE